jgi:hypothetical protein
MKTWLKAKLILLGILITWICLIVLMSPFQVPLTLSAIFIKRFRLYNYHFWIWQDQGINVIFGGNPDITISSKVGYMALNGSKTAQSMEVVIDWLFYITVRQVDHCRVSIELRERHFTGGRF